jgi:5-methylcytosine-specific restriction endonuclease McrA
MFEICKLQRKQFRIAYTDEQKAFIASMPKLIGKEWDSNRKLSKPLWIRGDGTKIEQLKSHISTDLNTKQEPFCAYCGMKLNLTSNDQIEHIAPKGSGRYPQFMFEESNLILACSLCNGFEKKEKHEYNI